MQVVRKLSQLTFATARESAQVSGLVRCEEQLRRDTVRALNNLLVGALSQFNVGHNMSDTQVAMLVNDLLQTYWYWRFDEFAYVLGQALRGKWGTVFNRLDAPTVHEWCQKYGQEREALLTVESEEAAKAYKLAEVNGPPPADLTTPEARALRQQLSALCDADLKKGWDYYRALPEPTPAQALKLAVATEVVNQRRAAHYLPLILKQFKPGAGTTERESATAAESRRLEIALLQGDWQAAGFASAPSDEWMALVRAERNEPMDTPLHQVFPPACPKCLQRPQHCVCTPIPQLAA